MIKQTRNWIGSLYRAPTTLGLLFLSICLNNGAEAADEQSIIRVDEFGYPNLNGIWNFDNKFFSKLFFTFKFDRLLNEFIFKDLELLKYSNIRVNKSILL